jgi:predicted AAA+ superfamily ATPase
MLGGKAISWSSKKQFTVALSSTESEYKALMAHATCEAIWLKRLLANLRVYQEKVILMCDNMSSIY